MLSTQLYHGLRVLAPRIHTLTGINDFFRRAARQVRLIDRKNYHATTAALLRKSFSSSSTMVDEKKDDRVTVGEDGVNCRLKRRLSVCAAGGDASEGRSKYMD